MLNCTTDVMNGNLKRLSSSYLCQVLNAAQNGGRLYFAGHIRRTMFMIHNSLLWVVLCHVKHVSVYQMLDTIIQSRFVNVILKLWL